MPTPSLDGRVTPAMLHVLFALAGQELHGYGIMQAIDERTRGSVEIGPGTLYRTLAHLSKVGWIAEVPDAGTGKRRVYRITNEGRDVARAEATRLARLVSWAEQTELLEGTR